MTDPNDFLMSGGVRSARFEVPGEKVVGTIVETDVRQQRDFATGEPMTWPDGNPRNQLVITLQTDEHDPDDPDDDGRRRIYAPKSAKSGSMFAAIQKAVRSSHGPLDLGGRLAVVFVGEEEPEQRGFSPRKLYEAAYEPPSGNAADDLLGGQSTPAQQPATGVTAGSLL